MRPLQPQNLSSRLSGGYISIKSSISLLDTFWSHHKETKASLFETQGCPQESSVLLLGTSGAPLGATLASRGLLDRIFGPGGRPGRLPDGSRTDFGTQSHQKSQKITWNSGFCNQHMRPRSYFVHQFLARVFTPRGRRPTTYNPVIWGRRDSRRVYNTIIPATDQLEQTT